MKSRIWKVIWALTRGGIVLLLVCTMLASWETGTDRTRLFTHFRFHYALVGLALAIWCIILVQWRWFVLAAMVLASNLVHIIPDYQAAPIVEAKGPQLRLLSYNVLRSNHRFEDFIAYAQLQKPDIILLTETTYDWVEAISQSPLHEIYHFRQSIPRYGYFGMCVLSKYPMSEIRKLYWAEARIPTFNCRVHVGNYTFRLYGLHPAAPPDPDEIRWRDQMLDALAQDVARQQEEVVILGDLNLTPYHPRFNRLLYQTGLTDSRKGFGRQASFPARWGILGLPLDHALISPTIEVLERQIGPKLGSDHRPLVIDLRLPGK